MTWFVTFFLFKLPTVKQIIKLLSALLRLPSHHTVRGHFSQIKYNTITRLRLLWQSAVSGTYHKVGLVKELKVISVLYGFTPYLVTVESKNSFSVEETSSRCFRDFSPFIQNFSEILCIPNFGCLSHPLSCNAKYPSTFGLFWYFRCTTEKHVMFSGFLHYVTSKKQLLQHPNRNYFLLRNWVYWMLKKH